MKKGCLTKINIYNQIEKRIGNKAKIKSIIKYILRKESFKSLDEVNIIITDEGFLKNLNKKFFGKDRPTNVISFNLGTTGEIYISKDEIRKLEDLYYYLIHGLLHIIGYDHRNKKSEDSMHNRCLRYLNKFGI